MTLLKFTGLAITILGLGFFGVHGSPLYSGGSSGGGGYSGGGYGGGGYGGGGYGGGGSSGYTEHPEGSNHFSVQTPISSSTGVRLYPNDEFISADHRFRLVYQGDGNLVLYQGSTPLWASNTVTNTFKNGYDPRYTQFQTDGNLVVYNARLDRPALPVPVWASNTYKYPGDTLNVQNDGNIVIISSDGRVRWASNTCCH